MENENLLDTGTEPEVEPAGDAELEVSEPEVEVTVPENEDAVPESEAAEPGEASQDNIEESVSSGDAIGGSETNSGAAVGSYPTAEEIAAALSLSGTEVIVVQEYTLLGENAKPIDQYSVTEGLLLIIVLVLIGQVISKLIGGALSCKYLFRKL